jgi:hypothetical protein
VLSLADTTVTVSGSELLAITAAIVLAFGLQIWAMVGAVQQRRWGWLAAIWVLFPLGMLAWLGYARRHRPGEA